MRSIRWIAVILAVATGAILSAGNATAAPRLTTQIAEQQVALWRCQDQLSQPRTKYGQEPWALPRSTLYRKWVLSLWKGRHTACIERLRAHQERMRKMTIPDTSDWLTAVRYVQRIYPGTAQWLLYISHREGGWGRFVMNRQGSGAGGWMQFMASTFYAYNDGAYADARARGFIVNPHTNSWTHPLGQAITAGWMRYTGRDGCHWCLY